MKFKWNEHELDKVAREMYRLMTLGANSVLEHWTAFKMAQSAVNPKFKYSTLYPNTKLMRELKSRVARYFANPPVHVEPKALLSPQAAHAKALNVLNEINKKTVPSQLVDLVQERNRGIVGNTVKKIVAEQFCLSYTRINDDDTMESLGGDSLDLVEVIMAIEEDYGLELEDSLLENLTTVGELINLLLKVKYQHTIIVPDPEAEEKEKIRTAFEAIKAQPKPRKTRQLLTGNVVEDAPNSVSAAVITTCPRKWVLVDLETGEQWGLLEDGTWGRPIRRVSIPKKKPVAETCKWCGSLQCTTCS